MLCVRRAIRRFRLINMMFQIILLQIIQIRQKKHVLCAQIIHTRKYATSIHSMLIVVQIIQSPKTCIISYQVCVCADHAEYQVYIHTDCGTQSAVYYYVFIFTLSFCFHKGMMWGGGGYGNPHVNALHMSIGCEVYILNFARGYVLGARTPL